ncbi:hypothetical protein ACMYYO_01920 [Dermacoccaceae bacterium W4C1]
MTASKPPSSWLVGVDSGVVEVGFEVSPVEVVPVLDSVAVSDAPELAAGVDAAAALLVGSPAPLELLSSLLQALNGSTTAVPIAIVIMVLRMVLIPL